ncbi:phosphonate metabolism transcriptional regulator PhnF [Amphritea pacifica]|uniref:Phosphonate metabolism transcriptional regulator PhnF n=1 Tax=Amphritea pacifica TaxID=2811233 RepID=A0ABS2W6Q5_9GAMM|nr:phosphonate metabolism transcriptional regulator PhnF [Amphritea pacifica]MBN0987389.1 phosphonate metabolism transcriptional regulator PhnF [Amphritea pacifica]MBN1006049.1 phosphonate metabolism transcriptional regulator PhnF [Amphritea pacifica]
MAIYQKIATQLREEISAQYTPGDLLPPENQLADRFDVNRHTVRRAIDELVQDGLVRRHQGLGCRVVQKPIDYALHDRAAFSHNLNQIGLGLETEVVGCRVAVLPEALAERLALADPPRIIELQTRRFIGSEPVCLIRHYLFDLPDDALNNFSEGSLHTYLLQNFDLVLQRGTTRLRARMPTFDECNQLAISRGIPVMEVHTRNYCRQSGALREYSIARSRSDYFEYRVEPTP